MAAFYDFAGNLLSTAYDYAGNMISGDYDKYDTEYQHQILNARNAWAAEYRTDSSIIPLVIHTDDHAGLNSGHKSTFDYLNLAVNWSECSGLVGLGDVCSAVYNTTDLNNMVSCLSSVSKSKQINVVGNHDVWAGQTEGSEYFYSITDQWDALGEYFDNSTYGSDYIAYDNRGNQTVVDSAHDVRYCIMSDWYYYNTDTEENQPYYKSNPTAAAVGYWIDMLSKDDHDIIVLSHVQPYISKRVWTYPAVDGNDETTAEKSYAGTSSMTFNLELNQILIDRKNHASGTITDSDGNEHTYDFSGCTKDLICTLHGHEHLDAYGYSTEGTIPAVMFDAYRYDNCPMFFVNIDRTNERLNIWKFDEAENIYNYQIPFTRGETD